MADHQTLLIRRGIAAGVAILILILLIFGIKGCLDDRKRNSLTSYNSRVTAILQDSDRGVSTPLFKLLSSANGQEAEDLVSQVSQLRGLADSHLKQAEKLDTPDEMKSAQRNILLVLAVRRNSIQRIAQELPTALGKRDAKAATQQIAFQMRGFLSSDFLFSQVVAGQIRDGLDEANIGSQQRVAKTRFLPSTSWLSSDTVAAKLSGSNTTASGSIPPGTHGFGLVAVSAEGTTLQTGSANRIAGTSDLTFDVKAQNQGENDEKNVKVKITISGSGDAIVVQKTISEVKQGAEVVASIPLGQAPPIGAAVTVKVEIVAVPGEKNTDNNKESYPAIFTR